MLCRARHQARTTELNKRNSILYQTILQTSLKGTKRELMLDVSPSQMKNYEKLPPLLTSDTTSRGFQINTFLYILSSVLIYSPSPIRAVKVDEVNQGGEFQIDKLFNLFCWLLNAESVTQSQNIQSTVYTNQNQAIFRRPLICQQSREREQRELRWDTSPGPRSYWWYLW